MISENLLINSVTVKHTDGIDRDGNRTATETVMSKVRVEVYNATAQGQAGAQTADGMTLYIDPEKAVCTAPDGEKAEMIIPAENDAVVFNGRQYEARKITPRYTRGNAAIHHYEVELV